MKVLFFTYDFPYPVNSGGKNRAYHLLKFTAKKADITLFSFTRKKVEQSEIEAIEALGIKKIYTFKRRKLKSLSVLLRLINPSASIFKKLYFDKDIRRKLIDVVTKENISVVHYESFYTAYYVHSTLKELGVKQIVGTENIEHWLYQEYIKTRPFFSRPLYGLEVNKIKKEEEKILQEADATIAVTEAEAAYIHSLTKKPTYIVDNGIDTKAFSYLKKKKNESKQLLFIGNFSYFPNVLGINRFYTQVFSLLENNNISLTIIGKGATKLSFVNDKRIIIKEYVQDIQEEYKKTHVVISPIMISGGTNFKILEAMALGIPVVAYKAGAKGLEAISGKHLFLAENDSEFKDYVITLLNDENVAQKISEQARKLIEEKYDWKDIGEKLYTAWKEIL